MPATKWLVVKTAAFILSSLTLLGCDRSPDKVGPAPKPAEAAAGHSHDGWWCDEHGVPEEVCALCNLKLAADFKSRGDWCKEHDRPDSQCFICHPEKQDEFAAQYEAKYGKRPPNGTLTPHDSQGHEHPKQHEEDAKS